MISWLIKLFGRAKPIASNELQDAEGSLEQTDHPIDSGPGTVLVLMKFNIPDYERWFQETIAPTVQQFGTCIRITKGLDDWKSEMLRVLRRADATLIDLSHDLTGDLSPNVIWELNQLYSETLDKKLKRQKVLCFARGFDGIKTREETPFFVYSGDVNPTWLPTRRRGMDPEELLGMRIRKYNPNDASTIQRFSDWLSDNLSPWVQGVRAPLSDNVLSERTLDLSIHLNQSELVKSWLRAIADRDIQGCWKLARESSPPAEIADLLGCMLATVSASDTHSTQGYWPLVNSSITTSETLRKHYYQLLRTRHLHQQHWATTHFRENVWLSFRNVKLCKSEMDQLKELSRLEKDADIRVVVESVLIGFLPEAEQAEARSRAIHSFYGIKDP